MKHQLAAFAILPLLFSACAAASQAAGTDEPATNSTRFDQQRHPTHPAANRQLVIPSGTVLRELGRPAEMNALFFLAAGEGPKPTMLLLHGLPGNERNLDLAQAVRRSGWNVLTFTYRGAWGSEGTFSLQNAADDSAAALAFLRTPAAALAYGIDLKHIVIAGHSMGGYMAAHTAATQNTQTAIATAELGVTGDSRASFPPIAGAVLLDAWDISTDARAVVAAGPDGRAAFIAGFDDVGHSLGSITATDLYENIVRDGANLDLLKLTPILAKLPTLTIYATHGGAVDNRRIAKAITSACVGSAVTSASIPCSGLRAVELNSDHSFADSRLTLIDEVVGWLTKLPR